jgi:hypothetical protein
MWTLSGFADEIDPDLNAQCDVLQQLGIGFLELRSAWDVNVLDLTDQQVDGIRRTLAERGLQVSSIRSPIGKVNIEDDFDGFFSMEPHLATAHHLGGFSGPDDFVRATKAFTELLAAEGIPYR